MKETNENFNLSDLNGRPLRLLIGGSPCVPAGTKIKVKEGYKNIEDICIGDEVLTHKNRYRSVLATMNRKTDSLYYIKFNGSEVLKITGNHPLYILRNNEFQWIETKDVKVGDFVTCNINQENNDGDDYSDEDLWLMGRLLADGYRDKTRKRVFFSVAKKKIEEFEHHINNAGYHYYIIHKDRSAPEYVIENETFYEKCLIFTDGAINKYVPDVIIDLQPNKLKLFIDGYLSGDGHLRKNRKETYMWSTISFDMVLSLAMAIAKIHHKYPTVTKKIEKNNVKQWSDGRISKTSDSYNSQIALQTLRTSQKVVEDKLCIPIKNIEKYEYDCDVYNISVDEDESYTVNNVIVHNCTHWSICQKQNREVTNEGEGWELFLNYVIAKEKFKPDFFLYENNNSISKDIKAEISKALESPIQMINAALVSAQQRKRIWVHNIPNVEQPEDRGLVVNDILEQGLVEEEMYYYIKRATPAKKEDSTKSIRCASIHETGSSQEHRVYSTYAKSVNLMANGGGQGAKTGLYTTPVKLEEIDLEYWKGGLGKPNEPKLLGMIKNEGVYRNGKQPSQQYRIYDANSKGICLNTGKSTSGIYMYKTDNENVVPIYYVKDNKIVINGTMQDINIPDGAYVVRKLTPVEAERLQTLPDNYTYTENGSDSQRYKMIGNGWCAEVVAWILSHIDIPKDYPVEVLSMYDGIGTGRYVLDKLGFTNITYKAYEIDKPAMEVALKNYPDIIECGDAFQVREGHWKY